ncbi:hypothetical protein EAE32_00240 [Kocuria tytonicola]|uniref:DUF4097 domain-containing protein n=1 Tax=Kocuria tytonicola TaxID=2055946 RepID=A0A3L9L3V4_9MICC|nr:DUF4097 family beta strand repeat-containing protein [Kocuria tytonicola]RLY93726.1 hypothetical protein EAE32_00240 [Kocuria tytonicola]
MSTHTPSPATPDSGSLPAQDPRQDRPLPRGERRAWNTATAVVGGVAAIGLLVGGAGVTGALALTQEHNGSWTAPSAVKSIHVTAADAAVYIHTSATADRVEVLWSEAGINIPDRAPSPVLDDGELSLDLGAAANAWGLGASSNRSVSVTVPEDSAPVSLDLEGTTNSLSVEGTFQDVVASTDTGAVEASDLEAATVDARSTNGRVLLDGVHVSNRLDAHTDNGMVLVGTQGASPKRASVTAGSGYYGVAMPTADYWYPQSSQKDFANPRHPVTTDPVGSDPSDPTDDSSLEYYGTYDHSPLPTEVSTPSLFATAEPSASATPRATSGGGTPASPSASSSSVASERPRATSSTTHGAVEETGRGHDADTVCKAAPRDRPCLYLQGTPMSVKDSGWMNAWHDGWRSPGTRQDRDDQPEQDLSESGSPAREN